MIVKRKRRGREIKCKWVVVKKKKGVEVWYDDGNRKRKDNLA